MELIRSETAELFKTVGVGVMEDESALTNLLHDALNAALNLSGYKPAQPLLARHGLWTLVQIWYHAQQSGWVGTLGLIAEMTGDTLFNLAGHEANRTPLYVTIT